MPQPASDTLKVHREGAVLTLTLERPSRRNALTVELANGLRAAVLAAGDDPEVRAVVLAGSGGSFCSGIDLLAALEGGDPSPEGRAALVGRVLVDALHPLVLALWTCPKPTVAALNGATVGFGLSLALACDLRVLADDAYLSSGFAARGLMPDGGVLHLLERLCGLGRALELGLRPDRKVTAPEAHAWGLCQKTSPPEALLEEAQLLARQLTTSAPLSQRYLKASLHGAEFAQVLREEVPRVLACLSSQDATEGAMAFFEKRAPVFTGV